jgi:signal transduction histidine kinase
VTGQPIAQRRILLVAETDEEALRAVWEMRRAGPAPAFERVDTRSGLEAALARASWDVVVTSYGTDGIGCDEVVALVARAGHDVPVVLLAGAIGEEAVASAMQSGIAAYVPADERRRLPQAIDAVLRRAAMERDRRATAAESARRATRFDEILSGASLLLFRLVREGTGLRFAVASAGAARVLGIDAASLLQDAGVFLAAIEPDDRARFDRELAATVGLTSESVWDIRLRAAPDAPPRTIRIACVARRTDQGDGYWDGYMSDISDARAREARLRAENESLSGVVARLQRDYDASLARIARDARDEIGGNVSALKMTLQGLTAQLPGGDHASLEKAQAVERLADKTLEAITRFSGELRPGIVDIGLVASAQWLAAAFANRTGIACNCESDPEEIEAGPALTIAVFRILEGALENVERHAGATQVVVSLGVEGCLLEVQVTDNGRGIGEGEMHRQDACGIRTMVERARALGGGLDVLGLPGHGTRVILQLPLAASPATDSL